MKDIKELTIQVKPDAWATTDMTVGPNYGKVRYDKMPIQSLNPLRFTHEKLYLEKTVIGLMKAAYYDGYTERESELRHQLAGLAQELATATRKLEEARKMRPALLEVETERVRQDAKWGGAEHDDQHSVAVFVQLIEDYAGWARTMAGMGSYDKARNRLIQVAALAVAGVETIDRAIEQGKGVNES